MFSYLSEPLNEPPLIFNIHFSFNTFKGGGGGGFWPIILETLIMRYGLKGKGRTRPDFFRVVLGPCAQFYPCEASEQKWGQPPKY